MALEKCLWVVVLTALAEASSAIMVYFRHYFGSWLRGFYLVLFQKTKWNEMKKMDERKKAFRNIRKWK